jgi:hypothetical protein
MFPLLPVPKRRDTYKQKNENADIPVGIAFAGEQPASQVPNV